MIGNELVDRKMSAEDFTYLESNESRMINNKTDADHWKQTLASLEIIGFVGNKLKELLKAVFVVMFLGNLKFVLPLDKDEKKCVLSTEEELDLLSDLLGIDSHKLKQELTTRSLLVRGNLHSYPISIDDACKNRDSLAKEIYGGIFSDLCKTINDSTAPPHPNMSSTIGILDTYGFERVEESINGFEQLLINYINEKLRHEYLQKVFIATREEYDREGIDLIDYEITDNSAVLDLFEQPSGLIALLRTESALPDGNSTNFVSKLKAINGDSTSTTTCLLHNHSHKKIEFGIKHFAGEVVYDAHDFVGKDTDDLPVSLIEIVTASHNSIINTGLMASLEERKCRLTDDIKLTNLKYSTSLKFTTEFADVLNKINNTKTWWIYCIKPNNFAKPKYMDNLLTVRQIQIAGIDVASKISKELFSVSMDFEEMFDKFGAFLDKEYDSAMELLNIDDENIDDENFDQKARYSLRGSLRSSMRGSLIGSFRDSLRDPLRGSFRGSLIGSLRDSLSMEIDQIDKEYAVGNGRVYFSDAAIQHLYSKRMKWYTSCVILVQRMARKLITRAAFKKKQAAAIIIQKNLRRNLARQRYVRTRCAAVLIKRVLKFKTDMVKARNLRTDRLVRWVQAR